MPGQVNLDSELGRALYALAKEPDVLVCVEVGTWNGEGSTLCMALGLAETCGRLISVELNTKFYERAARFYSDKSLPVELIHGSALSPEAYSDFTVYEVAAAGTLPERTDPGCFSRWYEEERAMARQAPRSDILRDVLQREPCIDLAFLDGGEFTSFAEFQFLEPHISKYVVLDDTNPVQSVKNVLARERILQSPQWAVVRDELQDRNGWLVARRSDRDTGGADRAWDAELTGRR